MRDTWTLTLSYRSRPICPGCARPLNRDAAVVVKGWLFCEVCYRTDLATASTIHICLNKLWTAKYSIWCKGVKAYAPRDVRLHDLTIIEADLLYS
jgi:hypothetical protein